MNVTSLPDEFATTLVKDTAQVYYNHKVDAGALWCFTSSFYTRWFSLYALKFSARRRQKVSSTLDHRAKTVFFEASTVPDILQL